MHRKSDRTAYCIRDIVLRFAAALAMAGTTVGAQGSSYPAPHSFARYAVPAECARAAVWTEQQFWRDRRMDTVYIAPAGMVPQPATVATIRGCLLPFTVGATAPRELIGLARAALAANLDAMADSAVQRLLTIPAESPSQSHAWTLYRVVTTYGGATQPRIARAVRYAAALDSIGVSAAVERMLAHTFIGALAIRGDSLPLLAQESAAAMKARDEIAGDQRHEYALEMPAIYDQRAYLKARAGDGDGARAIIAEGNAIVVPLRARAALRFQGLRLRYALWGKPAPAIRATQWYDGNVASPVHPRPGVPSLVLFASHTCRSAGCYAGYSVIRRLSALYGPKLDITIPTQTTGFYLGALVRSDTEAVKTREFFIDQLKLPAAVAVWQSDFHKIPDGRVTSAPSPNLAAYPMADDLRVYIVGANGIVRFVGTISNETEAAMRNILKSAM